MLFLVEETDILQFFVLFKRTFYPKELLVKDHWSPDMYPGEGGVGQC